jgi:4-carboxymuconolactone decarboxylase
VAPTTVPPVDVPAAVEARLAALGAPAGADRSRLYRLLANQPELLEGWVEMAWRLRTLCTTPRALRELMIVRGAQLTACDFELKHHLAMARQAGVPETVLADVDRWRESEVFSPSERAALALTEAMLSGHVPDAVNAELELHFSPAERIELMLTAGFYVMVPRVIDALRLTP